MNRLTAHWLMGAVLFCLVSCNSRVHRFEQLLHFSPPADVHHIEYKDDVLVDAAYWLAFECSPATARRIISSQDLYKDISRGNYARYGYYPKEWWDVNTIDKSEQYSSRTGHETQVYFWYHPASKRAFLLKIEA